MLAVGPLDPQGGHMAGLGAWIDPPEPWPPRSGDPMVGFGATGSQPHGLVAIPG